MKFDPRILAGTALGLLMASSPMAAFPLAGHGEVAPRASANPVILAQADAECAEGESAEACAARRNAEKSAPAPQEVPAEPAPEPQAEQPAPAPEPAPEPEPAPQAEEPAPAPAPEPAPEPKAEQPAPQPEPAPEPEPTPAPQAEEPAPAPEPAPEPKAEQPAPEAQPQAEPSQPEAPAEPAKPAEPPQPTEPAPEQPAPEQPAAEQTAPQAPAAEQPAAEQPSAEQPSAEQPAEPAPASPNEAPILDSQKEAQPAPAPTEAAPAAPEDGQPTPEQPAPEAEPQPVPAPAEAGPPPVDDSAAQQAIPVEQLDAITPITEEQGTRVEIAPDVEHYERPSGVEVIQNIDNRVILQINNQVIVESNEQPRITRGARDVYYEDLPRNRTREVIIREDGTQIVTIYNRYGDILQRSRIAPDGHEYVLNYVDDRYYDDMRDWRDPGLDLPPMYLTIPREDYILESRRVRSPEIYYAFLEQPPVERVTRLYSVNEVKRSARVRDIARRIDLDTLNFELGSASLDDREVEKLAGVADAIEKMLRKNPAETFLIEGHTDAVGSDRANLVLSDRRAEAVAQALTGAFGIPPENLTTQGYGEQYLKIKTQKPERENRRVTIRRITPLVAPVARAK